MGCWPYEKITKEFNIGDSVKLIKKQNVNAEVGATAIVVGFEESYDDCVCYTGMYYLQVKWERNGLDHGQSNGGYYPDEFLNISRENKSTTISSCPVCGGELKDKYSEYVGGNIKKCSNCGWC